MPWPRRKWAAGPVVWWMLTAAAAGADEASSVALVRKMLNSRIYIDATSFLS